MAHTTRLHERCCHAAAPGEPANAFEKTPRVHERDRPFDVTHLALDVAIHPAERRVAGTTVLSLARRDAGASEVVFDAVGFEVSEVTLDGAPAAYRYDGERLVVPIASGAARANVAVRYDAWPKRGLFFLEPDEAVPHRPRQVWTQCQDEDARHWFVCHDKPHMKQTTELTARVPSGWAALSNGDLVSQTHDAGFDVFHFRMDRPHPSYLVTLVAGDFAVVDGGRAGVNATPLAYLVPRGREADAIRSLGRTGEMLEAFERRLGVPYPYGRYSQVVVADFSFGGMENTSATTLYEHALYDEAAALDVTSDDLIAHELGHQWFGDLVTCRDFSHGWLNEGFATYMEHLDREARLSVDEYFHFLDRDQDAYLGEAGSRYKRALVEDRYEAPIDVFDRHLYEKGGLVLHLLRMELGDDAFFGGVRTYLERHAHGVVETRDLQRALEDASGKSLGAFFTQWVLSPGHARVTVRVGFEEGRVVVNVTQDGEATTLPLELDVASGGAVRRVTLALSSRESTHRVPADREPDFVVVDPRHRILGEVTVEVPLRWAEDQLESGPTSRARWLAARVLGRRDEARSVRKLGAVLGDTSAHWTVRAEAARALGHRRSVAERDALLAHVAVDDPRVRRAVAQALSAFGPHATPALRALVGDRSQLVSAEAVRSLGEARSPEVEAVAEEALGRASWGDVVPAAALEALGHTRRGEALIRERTAYGRPLRIRRAAVRALGKLGASVERREHLEGLLADTEAPVRQDAALALLDLGDEAARPKVAEALALEREPRVRTRMREVLAKLTGSTERELHRLTTQGDDLRAEIAALRGRVAKLEERS